IIVCDINFSDPGEAMLAESVSGLAAQAVNEGKYDALVWINVPGWGGDVRTSFSKWLAMAKARLVISNVETKDIWTVVDDLKKRDLIKGYVLFEPDVSDGNAYTKRAGNNHSTNMATTAAGVMKAVMIT